MNFIGLDVHKKQTQICVLTPDGKPFEKRVQTEKETLVKELRGFAPARLVLEASTESEWVARQLEKVEGFEVVVADPNFEAMYGYRNRKIKTDIRDARALAEASQYGIFRKIHRVSPEQRQVRHLLLIRQSLLQSRTRWICVIRALLRQEGIGIPTGSSSTFGRRVRKVEVPLSLQSQIDPLLEAMDCVEEKIQELEVQLEGLCENNESVKRLKTVPMIGNLTALYFLSSLDGAARFPNRRHVQSCFGLIPKESSSGEKQHRGNITKVGSPQIRSILVEAAWRILLSRNPKVRHIQQWTTKIAQRRDRKSVV